MKQLSESTVALPKALQITVLKEATSTNTLLKFKAKDSAPEGTIIIAEKQTEGRGRMGHSFFSPGETGLYISILLRPELDPSDCLYITTAAAVAASRALERLGSRQVGIKWINDLFIDDKKVGGILTEASVSPSTKKTDYAILGIGINLSPPGEGFPEDIKTSAGCVFASESEYDFSKIVTALIEEFFTLYYELPSKGFMSEYKQRSILIGRQAEVICGNEIFSGTVCDISSEGQLTLLCTDNAIRSFSAGEARAKPITR